MKESIEGIEFQNFQEGIDNLLSINIQENDSFHKNREIDNVEAYYDLYQDFSQENQNRAKYLEQLTPLEENPKTVEELKAIFPQSIFGFLGINFPQLDIDKRFCTNNNKTFLEFKKYWSTLITHENFTELKNECFSKIIFCDSSEEQLKNYGNGKYFHQCIQQFIELEIYLKSWTNGSFNYQDLKEKTSITLSPESATTMNKYKSERVFSLPQGGTAVFELHIKLGDIRIHILQDNSSKKIMIGYIGKHLTI
ncbi:hypothetical protein PG911_07705 [Tenacibaculum ovolyticum]|uniref:hypothetical protein n=1 Tax=Tenacibaculum ovolyticum TaxID=104270 RepID=UPI0022F388F5|nr:hypothetical protein [Tenacibaculum ovolyticum]WBX78132.1 hypothetical protein PG911_07705 [Tenacibaculum ovolyticum]